MHLFSSVSITSFESIICCTCCISFDVFFYLLYIFFSFFPSDVSSPSYRTPHASALETDFIANFFAFLHFISPPSFLFFFFSASLMYSLHQRTSLALRCFPYVSLRLLLATPLKISALFPVLDFILLTLTLSCTLFLNSCVFASSYIAAHRILFLSWSSQPHVHH